MARHPGLDTGAVRVFNLNDGAAAEANVRTHDQNLDDRSQLVKD